MDATLWIAYVGAAAALLFLPGPDWAFMLATGARQHRIAPAVTGLTLGYVVLALVVAAGLGPLITTSPTTLVAVTVAGAAYLVYLGSRILRAPRTTPDVGPHPAPAAGPADPACSLVRQGLTVSSLNAKSLILFVAFFPQFITPSAPWPLPAQLAVLGLTWAAMGAVFYALLGRTSHTLFTGRAALAHAVTQVTGGAMILMGVVLAAEQLVGLTNRTV